MIKQQRDKQGKFSSRILHEMTSGLQPDKTTLSVDPVLYVKIFVCLLFILLPFVVLSCTPSQSVICHSSDESRIGATYEDLAEQVIIRRTEHGVPHIMADSLRAAGYALGYLQMEDYGERVAKLLLRARGEWAKYNEIDSDGLDGALDADAANRRDYARAVETWHLLEADTRHLMEGFAAGVNRYIELHPGEFDDWVRPFFTGYDVHARRIGSPSHSSIRRFLKALERQNVKRSAASLMPVQHGKANHDLDQPKASPLSENNSEESDKLSGLHTPQTVWARLAARAEEPPPDVGSNAWALAPSRTTSGHAILVRNPHLSWTAGYYEAHITVPGILNFYGDFRIGAPLGIIGGFNERLGWATTNNYPDLDEIYAFEADSERPDHYLLDGASLPLTRETVTVEFKNGESLGRKSREFWSTPFGPVIHREGGKIYVIHAAGDGEYRLGEQFLNMMKAQNIEEWKTAMRTRARTSSNLTYADADGNILYVWNATIPDLPHVSGRDTLAILVSRTDQIWKNLIPWDDLPRLENPQGGYLRNENDSFHYTNLNEILDAQGFPSWFPEPGFRLRSQHSDMLINNNQTFSLEGIVALKHSMRMLLADRVKEDLVAAVRTVDPPADGEIAKAIEHIERWDNTVARDSRGGVLFKVWWERYVKTADRKRVDPTSESAGFPATPERLFREPWSPDHPSETPRGLADPDRAAEAFEWAVKKTKDRYGDWNLAWGEVHRARIGDKDVAVGGCSGLLGCFRVLWFNKHKYADKKLEVRGGDGWVLAVEFGDTPRAYSVLAYGQSIKEDSPYFTDQLEMFANNEMKRVAFTEEEIIEQLVRKYRPGQEEKSKKATE